ncbi:hypothetical protein JCM8202_000399 [Rhodotorula sphaerocarpa]
MESALLSHLAVRLRDRLASRRAVPAAALLATLEDLLRSDADSQWPDGGLRSVALDVAKSLQDALFLHDLDWAGTRIGPTTSADVLYAFSTDELDLPTGVVTQATRCFSPLCEALSAAGYRDPCYSFSCPRRPPVDATEARTPRRAVPSGSLEGPDDARQATLHHQVDELADGEQAYYDDLCLVETAFARPLRTASPPVIPTPTLANFLEEVLLNIDSIREHSGNFLAALRNLQRRGPSVSELSKTVRAAAEAWAPAYHRYMTAFPLADDRLRREKAANPAFARFLERFHDHPKAGRRGFDTFHSRPTFRALRYITLLAAVLKGANRGDPGRQHLETTLGVLQQQSAAADAGVVAANQRVAIRNFQHDVYFKYDTGRDLDLTHPSRRLLRSGPVLVREGGDAWREGLLYLFDHFLVVAKTPKVDGNGRNRIGVSRRPMPLDLVNVDGRIATVRAPAYYRNGRSLSSASRALGGASRSTSSFLFQVCTSSSDDPAGNALLYVDTKESCEAWREAIAQALERRASRRAVRFNLLVEATRLECTCCALLPVPGHPGLLLFGGKDGIYVGWKDRPTAQRRLIHLAQVTMIALCPPRGLLLALAAGVLLAYPLDALFPAKGPDAARHGPQKLPIRLSGQRPVATFVVGQLGASECIAYTVVDDHETIVRLVEMLEAPPESDRRRSHPSGSSRFRPLSSHAVPYAIKDLQVLRSGLCLIRDDGIEILHPANSRVVTVPNLLPLPPLDADIFVRRLDGAVSLGLFEVGAGFILATDKVACEVGGKGQPTAGTYFAWQTKPFAVALQLPFLFGLSSHLLEVRAARTGAFVSRVKGRIAFGGLG